ncbi:MAG TPA: ArgE/DapE family deacylase [Gemmatimonadales bacterium]
MASHRSDSPDGVTRLLSELVQINSINPAFSGGKTDERAIASFVAEWLDRIGLAVTSYEPEPGRMSVVGRRAGTGAGKSLMLYAHLDTVGVGEMAEPFSGAVRDGRVYGRGAYDMKSGLAACMQAAHDLADRDLAGDVLVVAVADEETESVGMQEVLRYVHTDAAIVTEPTDLGICLAHKGFCWVEVETTGRAAHGSRFDLGVDANMRMGLFLAALDGLERELRARDPHPLVGPPSLHVGLLAGGTGPSIYAARSRAEIERRTIPGETEQQVVREIEHVVHQLAAVDPDFRAAVRALLWRDPFGVDQDAAIVRAVADAATAVLGSPPAYGGQTPWMDAAFLQAAGIETVVLGASGAGAHAAEEWVDLESVRNLSAILVAAATAYCGRD